MAQKRVVGKFDKNLDKIEFYEIVTDYKDFTIIRKQGTTEYHAWDNKYSVLSGDLHIDRLPEDKDEMFKILEDCQTWWCGLVFFWADSKFVTEYGLPNYDKLVNIYKELIILKLFSSNLGSDGINAVALTIALLLKLKKRSNGLIISGL